MRGKPSVVGSIVCCVLVLTQAPGCLRSRTADQASDRANRDGHPPPAAVADEAVGISEVNEPKSTSGPPIIYWPRLKPEPLSGKQVGRIGRAVEDIGQGCDLWFALVLRNTENRETVRVYCVPDTRSPRVRRGTAFEYIWGGGHFLNERTFRYVQVSPSGDPFEGRPVPPDDFRLLPSALVHEFADNELIEIVDFIRSPPPWSPKVLVGSDGRRKGFQLPHRVDPNDPVYRIRRDGDKVVVEMGMVEGPMSGSLLVFTCEKADDGWTITDTFGLIH